MSARRVIAALVVALTLTVGILIGTLLSTGVRAAKPTAGSPDARMLPGPTPVELSNSFARIADSIEPAVVNINTESTVRMRGNYHPQSPEDAPFEDFFDHLFKFGPHGGSDFRQQSLGSGVILDKAGFVMTNYHVIMRESEDKPVDRIKVFIHGDDNPRGYLARIIGSDKSTDLAVIKIDAGRALTSAQFGDSDAIRVGDWVLAVGSPFGLDSTVTAGIISARDRRDVERGPEGQFKRFLQTDAAINPGNSGGPLVNLAGQVVGINTAIATRHGTSDGVGFAMPSNAARKVYNSLVATGSVHRGAIGVSFLSQNNAALLRSFGADHGVVVNSVEAGSPAEKAGIQRGDVITGVEGKQVANGDDLVSMVSDMDIGRKLQVQFLRDRKNMSALVQVGDRNQIVSEEGSSAATPAEDAPSAESDEGALGLTVRALTHEQSRKVADQLHLGASHGVLVTDVKPDAFGEEAGVQAGDIILSINHRDVVSIEDFSSLQRKLKTGMDVLLLVARPTEGTFATLFLAAPLQ
jgi:serine protease Do